MFYAVIYALMVFVLGNINTFNRVSFRCHIPECDPPEPQYNPPWLLNAVPKGRNNNPSRCERYLHTSNYINRSVVPLCPATLFNNSVTQTCNEFVFDTDEVTILNDVSFNTERVVNTVCIINSNKCIDL